MIHNYTARLALFVLHTVWRLYLHLPDRTFLEFLPIREFLQFCWDFRRLTVIGVSEPLFKNNHFDLDSCCMRNMDDRELWIIATNFVLPVVCLTLQRLICQATLDKSVFIARSNLTLVIVRSAGESLNSGCKKVGVTCSHFEYDAAFAGTIKILQPP